MDPGASGQVFTAERTVAALRGKFRILIRLFRIAARSSTRVSPIPEQNCQSGKNKNENNGEENFGTQLSVLQREQLP
jgi:hypothetical protein